MKATELAKGMGREFPPTMMHLLGLVRLGYVSQPEKGLYTVTEKGKEALAMPTLTKEKAEAILTYAPHDKAFHFYLDVGKPTSVHAHGMHDFANKIERVELESVQFHMARGDFESWFKSLGDEDLAKSIAALKAQNVMGEDLRGKLHDVVEQRYIALAKLSGQTLCPE